MEFTEKVVSKVTVGDVEYRYVELTHPDADDDFVMWRIEKKQLIPTAGREDETYKIKLEECPCCGVRIPKCNCDDAKNRKGGSYWEGRLRVCKHTEELKAWSEQMRAVLAVVTGITRQ